MSVVVLVLVFIDRNHGCTRLRELCGSEIGSCQRSKLDSPSLVFETR